jgi:hypothetical protein
MAETTDPREGWGVIRPGDRRAHYYRDGMSLCRRVGFYAGPLDPDDKPSPDDCAACRKQLDREQAKAAASHG